MWKYQIVLMPLEFLLCQENYFSTFEDTKTLALFSLTTKFKQFGNETRLESLKKSSN